jgi:hypothetical protein
MFAKCLSATLTHQKKVDGYNRRHYGPDQDPFMQTIYKEFQNGSLYRPGKAET